MKHNKYNLSPEDIELLHRLHEERKTDAVAVLGKHQDPTWIQMMDHIDLAFDNFQGIRGYWNIITDKWVVIMTDLAKAHELLRDAVSSIETVEYCSQSGFSWTEAQYNVAFEISNRCEIVRVRKYYQGERYTEQLSDEKIAAIEYRIKEEIIPKLKAIIYEQYPYQDKPRVLSNIIDIDIDKITDMAESEKYMSVDNGSFRYLVYRLKGMNCLDDMIEFEEWLEED